MIILASISCIIIILPGLLFELKVGCKICLCQGGFVELDLVHERARVRKLALAGEWPTLGLILNSELGRSPA